eukprot:403373123
MAGDFNWVQNNRITPVKYQGTCGSCYAIAVLESMLLILNPFRYSRINLSEQQIIDCTYGKNFGCEGGHPIYVFDYLQKYRSVSDNVYPYTGKLQFCDKLTVQINGIISVKSQVYGYTTQAASLLKIVQQQPVAIAVNAYNVVFQGYKKGIVNSELYCKGEVDHAVALVGYGQQNGTKYWIIKNSWGTNWGESGYIRIEMRDGNGICNMNTDITVAYL